MLSLDGGTQTRNGLVGAVELIRHGLPSARFSICATPRPVRTVTVMGQFSAPDHQSARRTTIAIMAVVLIGLLIAPVFILSAVTNRHHSDPAYQALSTYAAANNGNQAAAHQLSASDPSFVVASDNSGTLVLADQSAHGPCWELRVTGGTLGTPALANAHICQGRKVLYTELPAPGP